MEQFDNKKTMSDNSAEQTGVYASSRTQYEFPQQATRVSYAVNRIIDELRSVYIDDSMILDIYLDSRYLRKTKETVRNPYQYMRAVNGMNKAQYQVRYHDVEMKYNAAVVQMQGYEPIKFLSQYVAYCAQSKNDSGLENGMIYERFLGGIHSDSQKGYANQRIIIVDAAAL